WDSVDGGATPVGWTASTRGPLAQVPRLTYADLDQRYDAYLVPSDGAEEAVVRRKVFTAQGADTQWVLGGGGGEPPGTHPNIPGHPNPASRPVDRQVLYLLAEALPRAAQVGAPIDEQTFKRAVSGAEGGWDQIDHGATPVGWTAESRNALAQ